MSQCTAKNFNCFGGVLASSCESVSSHDVEPPSTPKSSGFIVWLMGASAIAIAWLQAIKSAAVGLGDMWIRQARQDVQIAKLIRQGEQDRQQIDCNKLHIEEQLTQLSEQAKTIVRLTNQIADLNTEIDMLRSKNVADELTIAQLVKDRDELL